MIAGNGREINEKSEAIGMGGITWRELPSVAQAGRLCYSRVDILAERRRLRNGQAVTPIGYLPSGSEDNTNPLWPM